MGTFYALAMLIILTGGAVLSLPLPADLVGDWITILPIQQFLLWMPLGCATAAVGGWLRDRQEGTGQPWALE